MFDMEIVSMKSLLLSRAAFSRSFCERIILIVSIKQNYAIH